MRKRHQILFVALSLVLWTVPAFALFTPIPKPNDAYLGQTNYIDFSLDSTPLDLISDGFLDIKFSSYMYKLSTPATWETWSVAPESQLTVGGNFPFYAPTTPIILPMILPAIFKASP